MAIGNDFNSLQAAILAEDRLKLDDKIAFRNYLVQQAQNRNQGRQVGVNQYDAETRRGLGFRNADETAAERDARYGFLDKELGVRGQQFADSQAFLRDQLKQKALSEEAAREIARQQMFLHDAEADMDRLLKEKLGMGQLEVYGKQLEAGQRPSEALRLEIAKDTVARAQRARKASLLADEINRQAATTGLDLWGALKPTRKNYESVVEDISKDPAWADLLPDVQYDPQQNKYVPIDTPALDLGWSRSPQQGLIDALRQSISGTNRPATFSWSTNSNSLVPVR